MYYNYRNGNEFLFRADVISVKSFFIGLMTFNIQNIPADFVLISHLIMVAFLMIIFPYSKLLHAPGLFFSPSRNQVDNAREKSTLQNGREI